MNPLIYLVEAVMHFFQVSYIESAKVQNLFETEIFCSIINVFMVTLINLMCPC